MPIDNASFIPLVHPIKLTAVSKSLQGEGTTPNNPGFTPLRQMGLYFYTHVTKQWACQTCILRANSGGCCPKGTAIPLVEIAEMNS